MKIKDEKELLKKLESDIAEYDKIFLIPNQGKFADEWINLFYSAEKAIHTPQKQLLLSTIDQSIHEHIDEHPFLTYRKITKAEADFLGDLYHMYEFSNRFFILSEEEQYGRLLNFIDTGLLNPQEAWEALLH